MNILPYLDTLSSVVIAGGVLFIFRQAYFAKKLWEEQQLQLKANHDLERRKMALDILHRHSLNVDKNTSRYLNFAFGLSDSNLKSIMEMKNFTLEKEDIDKYFPTVKMEDDNKLPFDIILDIRCVIIKIMNILEEIALSYLHKVADKKIIEDAMKDYLTNTNILDGCIKIDKAYSNGYSPMLEQFRNKLIDNLKKRESTA